MTACEPGWHRDPFHTASDSPCVVTTGWLHATVGANALAWGLFSLALCVVVAKLAQCGETLRSSFRARAYATCLIGGTCLCACFAFLWWDVRGELADRRAAWRALWLLGFIFFCNIGAAMLVLLVLETAVRLVGGLNQARSAQLGRSAKAGVVAFALSATVGSLGQGIALFDATREAQDTGVVLCFAGCSASVAAFAGALLRMASLLTQVRGELDAASSAAVQVAHLRKAMLAAGMLCASLPLPFVIIIPVAQLRSLGGILAAWAAAGAGTVLAAVIPFYERYRLGPAWKLAGRKRADKVLPGTASCGAIAAHAMCTTKELAADPARLAGIRAEQNRPEGLAQNGVSLAFMRAFADEYGVDASMTAADVCARHVKPATAKVAMSLVAVLQGGSGGGAAWVGAPTHFISYAWSYAFRTLVDILELHEQEYPPTKGTTNYYFLDQFSLNQHKFVADDSSLAIPHTPRLAHPSTASPQDTQRQILAALKAQMQKSGHVLMCMWPLEAPTPLARAWCLFELWVALQNGIKLTMCFGSVDAAALHEAVRGGSFDAAKMVGEIRAQDAGAMDKNDKRMILGLIDSAMGIDFFNEEMQRQLLACMKQTVASVIMHTRAR